MAVIYKQKCVRCNKNYVVASGRSRYVLCYECQKKEMGGEITDPKMKKFFNIPEELYTRSSFLRNIKINYLRYGDLTTNQLQAFRKVVREIRGGKAPGKKAKTAKTAKPKKQAR